MATAHSGVSAISLATAYYDGRWSVQDAFVLQYACWRLLPGVLYVLLWRLHAKAWLSLLQHICHFSRVIECVLCKSGSRCTAPPGQEVMELVSLWGLLFDKFGWVVSVTSYLPSIGTYVRSNAHARGVHVWNCDWSCFEIWVSRMSEKEPRWSSWSFRDCPRVSQKILETAWLWRDYCSH